MLFFDVLDFHSGKMNSWLGALVARATPMKPTGCDPFSTLYVAPGMLTLQKTRSSGSPTSSRMTISELVLGIPPTKGILLPLHDGLIVESIFGHGFSETLD